MTAPDLVCMTCDGTLPAPQGPVSAVRCEHGHSTPVIAGIADCRPPLVGFDIEADLACAAELAAMAGASFEELLRCYWASQPQVSPDLVERFVTGDLIGARRAVEVADQITVETGRHVDREVVALEVGCGTAALGAALAVRASWVVCSDVSLAWLVLARRRFELLGLHNNTLVAATGDHLPFADGTFSLVVAADVIEHVPDAPAMVETCRRVLRRGGTLWLSTPNRFSLTPEPHVRLWGVGLVPRWLALRYVKRFRDVDYTQIRTLSAWQLGRILRAGGDRAYVDVPPIASAVRATYGGPSRRLIDVYHLCRRLPVLHELLLLIAPLLHGRLEKVDGGT